METPVISVVTDNPRLVDKPFLDRLAALGRVAHYPVPKGKNGAELREIVAGSEILITGWGSPLLPADAVVRNGRLKYICHLTGEMKRIIPPEYIEAGVLVSNWGDAFSFATAEGAVALLLCVLKGIPSLDAQCREKGRSEVNLERPFLTLKGTDVGIYGLGGIGRQVAGMLRPFGPILHYYDPVAEGAPAWLARAGSLRELFGKCGVVTVHCGLNEATRGSVTYDLLSLMPRGGLFVNTSRGGVVEEKGLARALAEGRLYAGLDVIEDEPDWRQSPLFKAPGTLFTGHCLSKIGPAEKTLLQEIALDNIRAYLGGGAIRHLIDLKRYREMT